MNSTEIFTIQLAKRRAWGFVNTENFKYMIYFVTGGLKLDYPHDSLLLLSAKHSVLHPNSLPHCSLDDFMLVTSPLFVFCYPWR